MCMLGNASTHLSSLLSFQPICNHRSETCTDMKSVYIALMPIYIAMHMVLLADIGKIYACGQAVIL